MDALRQWFGVELGMVGWKEKVISAIGGALAIFVIIAVSRDLIGSTGAAMLIGSMGASAVLLFAVPHGALSQPWPALAGHLVSAVIGVSVAKLIDDRQIAAAVAVGLAIGAMYQLKCIHPPGGATALTAVMGGEAVAKLGYGFVLRPVMLNAVTIAVIAVAFNAMFPWRRYPAHLARRSARPTAQAGRAATPAPELSHEEILDAMRSLHSFVDITEDDLRHLHRILVANAPPPGENTAST